MIDAGYAFSPVEEIHTRPFPGFPTDMQSQILARLSVAYGDSCIYEHIFENRFQNCA